MTSLKKLIRMAKKWQKLAGRNQKRVLFPRNNGDVDAEMADEGHFVVYTTDRRRFTFPISYLSNYIFLELLRMSEEEFGLPSNGPITLPCDAIFMEYVVSLIQGCVDRHLQEALLMSVASSRCSPSPSLHHYEQTSQQLLVYSC
ncbi:hypothetical protein ACOSQ4_031946 [Xanthoceras sorbifolium]